MYRYWGCKSWHCIISKHTLIVQQDLKGYFDAYASLATKASLTKTQNISLGLGYKV